MKVFLIECNELENNLRISLFSLLSQTVKQKNVSKRVDIQTLSIKEPHRKLFTMEKEAIGKIPTSFMTQLTKKRLIKLTAILMTLATWRNRQTQLARERKI